MNKLSKLIAITPLERTSRSSFLLTIAFLLILDVVFSISNPLQYIRDGSCLPYEKGSLVAKIPEFIDSDSNPQVIIMGSSLPMMAIVNFDSKFAKSVDSQNYAEILRYDKAIYFSKLLNPVAQDIAAHNLTIAACMVSDTQLLLEEMIKAGKHPEIIVYGIGPRTFFDNSVDKQEKTPVWKVLSKRRRLNNILSEKCGFEDKRDCIISLLWNFYDERLEYQSVFSAHTKKLFKNWPPTANAIEKAKSIHSKFFAKDNSEELKQRYAHCFSKGAIEDQKIPKKFIQDLAVYDYRYNPPDFKQFEEQRKHMESVLKICKKNNIKLLVAAMPITQQNKNLIDKRLLEKYLVEIPNLTNRQGAIFVNLDDEGSYRISDFMDSVHTNASGGMKVQNKIADKLLKQNWL